MADTIKTKAALLTRLADNATNDITPQDLRDFLISYLVFGEIGMIDNAIEQSSLPAGINVIPLDQAGPVQGVTTDPVNNLLQVNVAGQYRVSYEASYKGTNSSRFIFAVLKNGVAINRTKRRDTVTAVNEERNVSGTGTIDLVPTDEIKLGIQVQPAGGDFTFISGGLRIERID